MTTVRQRTQELRERLLEGLELTAGEKLWLKRRASNRTQVEMADSYDVSLERYRGYEDGFGKVPAVEVDLATIDLGELVQLHRRRKGLTYRDLAKAVGMSKTAVFNAAVGRKGVERVVDYLLEKRDG